MSLLIALAGMALLFACLVKAGTSGPDWLLFWWRLRRLLVGALLVVVVVSAAQRWLP